MIGNKASQQYKEHTGALLQMLPIELHFPTPWSPSECQLHCLIPYQHTPGWPHTERASVCLSRVSSAIEPDIILATI